ncbi:50S ribosomal protein L2 [Candidatus Micrarchaeota archaeon]|nr:50S ribosomal protein L2 [Candidatus Micrarchaeota archaeon]
MGTRLIPQRRGKGGPAFKSPSHRYYEATQYVHIPGTMRGQVIQILTDPAHSTVMADILLENGTTMTYLAAEGLKTGDLIQVGADATLNTGNVMPLEKVPEGVSVFNVELRPGDGGRVSRASGSSSLIVGHDEDTHKVSVRLSSKRVRRLSPLCWVTIGVASGGGRLEKPLQKAGNSFYAMKSRNKYWPVVRGTAKSAYDHPHGGRSFGKSSSVSRNAPPGQKVGHIASSRTGRRRGRVELKEDKGD